MQIITIPHPTLRQKAETITKVDRKLVSFVENLAKTLASARNPRGVGLAANQVDRKLAVFATALPLDQEKHALPRIYINPQINDRSDSTILGSFPGDKEPFDEGCLSMPRLYGPVPRHAWIKLTFAEILNSELVIKEEFFENVAARVIQHEYDHLQGVLFTDHSLKHGLPVFKEVKLGRYEEVDPKLLTQY